MKDYRDRIIIDPKVLLGLPVVKNTRIPVYMILGLIAQEYSIKDIQVDYPDLSEKDIIGAIQFASDLTRFEEKIHV